MLKYIVLVVLLCTACRTHTTYQYAKRQAAKHHAASRQNLSRQLQSVEAPHKLPSRQQIEAGLELVKHYKAHTHEPSTSVALEFLLKQTENTSHLINLIAEQVQQHRPDAQIINHTNTKLVYTTNTQHSSTMPQRHQQLSGKTPQANTQHTYTLESTEYDPAQTPPGFISLKLNTPPLLNQQDFKLFSNIVQQLQSHKGLVASPLSSGLHIYIDFAEGNKAELLFLIWLYRWLEEGPDPRYFNDQYTGISNLNWHQRSAQYDEKIKSYIYYISQLINKADHDAAYYFLSPHERRATKAIVTEPEIKNTPAQLKALTSQRPSPLGLELGPQQKPVLKFSFAHHRMEAEKITRLLNFTKKLVQMIKQKDNTLLQFLKTYEPHTALEAGHESFGRLLADVIDPQGADALAIGLDDESYVEVEKFINTIDSPDYTRRMLNQAIVKGKAALASTLNQLASPRRRFNLHLSNQEAVGSDSVDMAQLLFDTKKALFTLPLFANTTFTTEAAKASPEVLLYLVQTQLDDQQFAAKLKNHKFITRVRALFSQEHYNRNVLFRAGPRSCVFRSDRLLSLWQHAQVFKQLKNKSLSSDLFAALMANEKPKPSQPTNQLSGLQWNQVADQLSSFNSRINILLQNGFKFSTHKASAYVEAALRYRPTDYTLWNTLARTLKNGESEVRQGLQAYAAQRTQDDDTVLNDILNTISRHENTVAKILLHLHHNRTGEWYGRLRFAAIEADNAELLKHLHKTAKSPRFAAPHRFDHVFEPPDIKVVYSYKTLHLDEIGPAIREHKHRVFEVLMAELDELKNVNTLRDIRSDALATAVDASAEYAVRFLLQKAPNARVDAAVLHLTSDTQLNVAKVLLQERPYLANAILGQATWKKASQIKALARQYIIQHSPKKRTKARHRCVQLLIRALEKSKILPSDPD